MGSGHASFARVSHVRSWPHMKDVAKNMRDAYSLDYVFQRITISKPSASTSAKHDV
ncbi:hypothetical protein IE4872_CH00570 [Rhizobium gallicum]|uniref:Uncharacterized protein n=1 Tax=Rhizobium gallicum TaxID=56730 RepID=A0A1L5NEB4_9HYPH|nr:hypothetical protein IE4872_CH00570 [Rhizobium gallicum]